MIRMVRTVAITALLAIAMVLSATAANATPSVPTAASASAVTVVANATASSHAVTAGPLVCVDGVVVNKWTWPFGAEKYRYNLVLAPLDMLKYIMVLRLNSYQYLSAPGYGKYYRVCIDPSWIN
jgi:zona occludens toxin (predicted ATPase)